MKDIVYFIIDITQTIIYYSLRIAYRYTEWLMHNLSICCSFSPARRGRCCPSGMSHGFLKEASTCVIETTLDVAFDEPFGACPAVLQALQGRVA